MEAAGPSELRTADGFRQSTHDPPCHRDLSCCGGTWDRMGLCETRATPESCPLTEEPSKEETNGHCDGGPSPVVVAREAKVLSRWRQ